ncbi:hypothetical protein ACFVGM_32590 [Kitasatospora purpeofusca]|uniref:hypothetical protein n=1 Tax=Kitasatospora purpeofusca TaxID=67352 RepID=UPI00368AF7C7
MTAHPYRARLSAEAAALVRAVLTDDQVKHLRDGLERAMADPWSWPASDGDDLDDSIRQIVLPDLIAHYVILPDPPVPHVWVITLTVL